MTTLRQGVAGLPAAGRGVGWWCAEGGRAGRDDRALAARAVQPRLPPKPQKLSLEPPPKPLRSTRGVLLQSNWAAQPQLLAS